MSMICAICGKGKSVGRQIQHKRGVAGKRWKKRAQKTPRTFMPNLQVKTVNIKGETKKIKICAKCIKKIKKDGKIGEYKSVSFI